MEVGNPKCGLDTGKESYYGVSCFWRGMNRKRSSEMIMERILDVCAHGTSKTSVIYQSNLNSATVKPYLDLLVDNGLLEVEDVGQSERTVYKTTKAGFEYMKNLKEHNDEILRLSSLLARMSGFLARLSLDL